MATDVTDEGLLRKIRGVKLLILDVDGVMTDGRIIIDDAGLESKQFDVRDGHGLKMIMRYHIDVVLLTGRRVPRGGASRCGSGDKRGSPGDPEQT